jgi:hypothetical protein
MMNPGRPSLAALVFGLALVSFATPARAQLPDLVSVSAGYMPGAELEDPRPTKVQLSSYDVSLNVPIVLGPRSFLVPGLGYHVDSLSFSDAPDGFLELRAFHAIDLSLLYVQLLPKGWSLSFRLAPGVAGDLRGFDERLLRVSGLAMATWSPSERLVIGGGLLADYSFGTFLPLPAAYVEWRPTPNLKLEAFLPAFAEAKVILADRVELGVRASVQGSAYGIRDDRIADAPPCAAPADPAQCFDHVSYSVATAGPQVGVRLFSSVWWTTTAGYSFYRRFEQKNADGERIEGGLQELPNGFVVQSGVTWRMPR